MNQAQAAEAFFPDIGGSMKVFYSLSELSQVPGPLYVAIGVFDGVHLGHQTLIRRAMDEAARAQGSAVVLTFHPHPARVLRPDSAPHLLTSTPHKLRLIEELGCRYLLQTTFDAAFAAQPPETFIEALVQSAGSLRMVCVGHNWAFGRGRSGNVALLAALGERFGFETLEIDPVEVNGELVSSTRIRKAVEAGDFETARRFLGRDYTILGTVLRGAGRGREIGFPTANLSAHNERFPPNGVYAVRALLDFRWLEGVANVGVRPTIGSALERVLEVHIFNYSGDCYGHDLEVKFERFLRPERKFSSIEELREQIVRDATEALQILNAQPSMPHA
ncbi:MAG TPA: bifunctional riboflavin kinase/FAD synthetase [Terrimicrobiaceae bacterium]